MDNIGSEIGQKMRCAVKAKLIELGTGYIDDELPDYVMIMVANKRSKQQMVDDLNLFLGMNTHIFVTWLHEVLDKLQEVTLPAPPPPKISKRRDHEKKKKEKKKKDTTSANILPALPSITEVIKEGFIQRAKQDLQVESQVKTKSNEKTPPPPTISGNANANGDGFDIPTISDIAKEAIEKRKHEKELEQLAELQKKIFIAKKQLQTMVSDDSDEDINIEGLTDAKKPSSSTVGAPTRTNIHINPQFFERNERIAPHSNNNISTKVHDRLGTKDTVEDRSDLQEDTNTENRRVVKLSAVRRAEREIYVPAFRRSEMEKQRLDSKDRQSTRDRNRRETPEKRGPLQNRIQFDHRSRTRDDHKNSFRGRTVLDRSRLRESSNRRSRSRSKSPLRHRRSPIKSISKERRPFIKTRLEVTSMRRDTYDEVNTRERIASRVFVIPPKPLSEEDDVDVPVNSIIKIKPRVVPEKQANKMLLLRAMADAQRSTFGSVPTKTDEIKARERRSIKDRLTIQVANIEEDELDLTFEDIVIEEDEYVPAPVSKTSESESENYLYIPKKKVATKFLAVEESDEYDPDEIAVKRDTNTKFVVTLDSNEKEALVVGKKSSPSNKQNTRKRGSIKDRIGYRMQVDEDEEAKRRRKERFEQGYERVEDIAKNRQSKKSRSRSPQDRQGKFESPHRSKSPVLRNRSNERKSDFWGDNKSDEVQVNHRRRSRARTISPINFDLTDEETRSRSSHEGQSDKEARREKRQDGESRPKIKKLEPTRKFDNVPSLLSTVTVADSSVKSKPKERCKFFPNCRDGSVCEFHHPSAPCNAFPSCKYGDKCAYLHPLCKFDQTCTRPSCNFMHTTPVISNTAPPLASSILPSQNYKPISLAPLPAICKFFPNCSNTLCTFYHPKPCRFGKLCHNKIECNFYHQDLPTKDKLKWVSSGV